MCVDHTMKCQCGSNSASFNFRDSIMPAEVVARLYCPLCSSNIKYRSETMLSDNGYVIQYDMDIARSMSAKLPAAKITPEFIFDEGYCTWRGVYPMDHIDSAEERQRLVELARVNKKRYLEEFKKWAVDRMDRLAMEGWRKANVSR